ncbi:MAG: hypothetical protein P8M80_17980, partial [Pirellulaceae bacterium]|nr:hypothetical protein [Pirellulaceae bacterium]
MASSSESENLPGNRFENFLNERISKTAQQVKWVDLFSITLLLTIGVLGFLFALCLVDAWIIELQLWMRWTAFALVFCGVAAFFVFFLLPLFVKRINPLYAAKKIEDSRPELKNSVINYLSTSLIKGNRPNRVVQQKLTQTAAADVANIPLDLAIDRSRMIFAGYALAGLVALFALYKVLSPKDPFQTIGRVMLPTAELAAPSRVTISEVSPGNDQKYFGEVLEVEARIQGLGKNEFAQLFVTTDDGRRKGYSIPMQFDDQLNVFRAMLSEDGRGLQESLRYWLVAGDATSPEFRVEVKTCPTIFLESAEYFSPAYTEIPDQKIENPDVISGVEGTIVRIQARTNLPIQSAWLELFRENKDPQRIGDEKSGFPAVSELKKVRQVRLDVEDEKLAMGELMLNWNRFRSQAEVTHYQLVFTSLDGDSSENPTLSKIEVTPDLSPEIEVVQPKEKTVEVPLDQTSKIEITAVDPDYRLTRIQLMGDCKGSRLFDKDLLRTQSDDGRVGKQVVQFDFSPVQFGLKPGDEVVLFASAEDNRCMGRNRIFDPLRGRTENYRVLVTEPLSPQDPKQGD